MATLALPAPAKQKRKYTKRTLAAAAPTAAPKRRGRKPKSAAAAGEAPPVATMAALLEKPETLGGAMKCVAKMLKTFTRVKLREALNADPDFAKLLEGSSAAAFPFNLKTWTDKGRLSKTGDGDEAIYTVVNLDF